MLELGHSKTETTRRAAPANASARLEVIFRHLFEIAAFHTPDEDEAYARADAALARLLRKDPALQHYCAIVESLRVEIESCRAEGRRRQLTAPCVTH